MTEHVVGAWIVRTNPQRLRLEGVICPGCDEKILPPRPACPNCHGETAIHPFKTQGGDIFDMTTASLPTATGL